MRMTSHSDKEKKYPVVTDSKQTEPHMVMEKAGCVFWDGENTMITPHIRASHGVLSEAKASIDFPASFKNYLLILMVQA